MAILFIMMAGFFLFNLLSNNTFLEDTYIDYETYQNSGMIPYSTSFFYDYVDIVDFDSVGFLVNYNLAEGSDIIFCEECLVLQDYAIQPSFNST